MSPYCSAHDECLIMKLCIYVGHHDAYNVSNFGGDPIKFKKMFYNIIYAVLRTWRSIAVTRSQFLRRLLRDHAQTAAVWKTVEEIRGHTSLSTALVCLIHTYSIGVYSTCLLCLIHPSCVVNLHFFLWLLYTLQFIMYTYFWFVCTVPWFDCSSMYFTDIIAVPLVHQHVHVGLHFCFGS